MALRPQEVYDREKKLKHDLEDHFSKHLESNATKSLKVSYCQLWKASTILVTDVDDKKCWLETNRDLWFRNLTLEMVCRSAFCSALSKFWLLVKVLIMRLSFSYSILKSMIQCIKIVLAVENNVNFGNIFQKSLLQWIIFDILGHPSTTKNGACSFHQNPGTDHWL